MNEIVVQPEALDLVQKAGLTYREKDNLLIIDALEMASVLCLKSLRSGVTILNLMSAEDVCVHDGKVTGVVANRSLIGGSLPVDPIVFSSKAVIDATGHEAVVARGLARHSNLNLPELLKSAEGPMDAEAGEAFVVDHVQEVFPGLWVTGMSVCATQGGPRMGPIFGGMMMSGAKVAKYITKALKD